MVAFPGIFFIVHCIAAGIDVYMCNVCKVKLSIAKGSFIMGKGSNNRATDAGFSPELS